MNKQARKMQTQERDFRLINWGRWNRAGNNPNLNYTTWGEMYSLYIANTSGMFIDDIDAQNVEDTVVGLYLGGLNGEYPMTHVWMFCLRVEFMEKAEESQRPAEVKAKYVRNKFQRKCSQWAWYKHIINGRNAVFNLSQPL